jgi:RHS repeat-associated protein
LGYKNYELSNHLGNVLVTISDRKLAVQGNPLTFVGKYLADVVATNDYSAFGAPMVGRGFNSPSYRYGFNGKENDAESVDAGEGLQDYGMRIYNPSIGKFLSVDPITAQYPELTPYQFASNSPLWGIDLDGLELYITTQSPKQAFLLLTVVMRIYATETGQQYIDLLNSNKTHIWADVSGQDNEYNTNNNLCTINPDNISTRKFIYTLGHELNHYALDLYRDNAGKDPMSEVSYETFAVEFENYLRVVFGDQNLRLEYDFKWYVPGSPDDIQFSNDPASYNPDGEKVVMRKIELRSPIDNALSNPRNSTVSFTMNKYLADAPEVTEAKSGIIWYYDYQENKDSPIIKMAILVRIYANGEEWK